MTPQRTSQTSSKPVYRHYVSQAILQHRRAQAGSLPRLSALPVEEYVIQILTRLAALSGNKSRWEEAAADLDRRILLRRWLNRIEVAKGSATLMIDGQKIAADGKLTIDKLADRLRSAFDASIEVEAGLIKLTLPVRLKMRSGAHRHELWESGGWRSAQPHPDRSLIAALARAHRWRRMLEAGEATTIDQLSASDGIERRHTQRTLRLAFLAPDLQQMIMAGRRPPTIQLSALLDADLPYSGLNNGPRSASDGLSPA